MWKKLLCIYVISLYILIVCGIKNYLYGNLVTTNNMINLTPESIDDMIFTLSIQTKTYEDLKYNLSQIQIKDAWGNYVLSYDIFDELKFLENTVENLIELESEDLIDNFNLILEKMNLIQIISDKKLKIQHTSRIDFDYFQYKMFILDNSYDRNNSISQMKQLIYFVRSNLEQILKKIEWYQEELSYYNPDIYTNYINSINNLYKTKYILLEKIKI